MTQPLVQPGMEFPGQRTPPALRWVASDLVSGAVLDDLPSLVPSYPLRRTIGKYESGSAVLMLDGAHPGWERVTLPGAVALHCYDPTDPAKPLLWSGIVGKRTRQPGTGKVSLSLSTGEYYLDRRLCGTYSVKLKGQNDIVADLVEKYAQTATVDADSVVDGVVTDTQTVVGIGLTVEQTDSGTKRDRDWHITEWASVYERLQSLSGVVGGPEWTIEWRWTDDLIRPVLLVANRLGTSPAAGLKPSAAFTLDARGGNLTEAEFSEDYGEPSDAGGGANRVIVYSSGEGKGTPVSRWHLSTRTDRPTLDYWASPSTSIKNTSVLDSHAEADLADLAEGSMGITLTASLGAPATPRFGSDWHLGDDIYWLLDTPEFPGGMHGTARAMGVEVGDGTISPIVTLNDPPVRLRSPQDGAVVLDGNGPASRVWSGMLPGRIIDGSGR